MTATDADTGHGKDAGSRSGERPRPRPAPSTADRAESDGPRIADQSFISYADFGENFFRAAVSEQRIGNAVAKIAGQPIDVGPLSIGPLGLGLVKVRAEGSVGEPALSPRDGELVAFDLVVPAQLAMLVEIGIDRHHFDATITIRLVLTARAAAPLRVVIDVEPPTKNDVDVDVKAGGLRSSVLQIVAGVDGELRRLVAKHVGRELDKPNMQQLRIIDVAEMLERAGS
ncbi:hypothetical protein [uncultured Jatrophihabitans sp.]|uniref:hypothetical protein n=1 Tax=uncultured Jatrophihabitans sp. TaxID=1610747 RepID=UPI0035CC5C26